MFVIIRYTATGYSTAGRFATFEEAVAAAKRLRLTGYGVSIRFIREGDES